MSPSVHKKKKKKKATHPRGHLHVLHCDVLENLAVVHVPDSLVVPDLRGQQDGTQDDSLPVPRTDVDLCIRQEPLQVDLHIHMSLKTHSVYTILTEVAVESKAVTNYLKSLKKKD